MYKSFCTLVIFISIDIFLAISIRALANMMSDSLLGYTITFTLK